MARLTAPFIGVALLAGAAWIATQSYEKNFADPALDPETQQRLGVQLLEFPRQLAPVPNHADVWQAIFIQPKFCDALCQGAITEQTKLGIQVIQPGDDAYDDLHDVTSAEHYASHQNKVLLVNPEGKFSGSIQPPYTAKRLNATLEALND